MAATLGQTTTNPARADLVVANIGLLKHDEPKDNRRYQDEAQQNPDRDQDNDPLPIHHIVELRIRCGRGRGGGRRRKDVAAVSSFEAGYAV